MSNTAPNHRTFPIWRDVQGALIAIRHTEFLLGFLPAKPSDPDIDWECVRTQLYDAREALGAVALALAAKEAGE